MGRETRKIMPLEECCAIHIKCTNHRKCTFSGDTTIAGPPFFFRWFVVVGACSKTIFSCSAESAFCGTMKMRNARVSVCARAYIAMHTIPKTNMNCKKVFAFWCYARMIVSSNGLNRNAFCIMNARRTPLTHTSHTHTQRHKTILFYYIFMLKQK